MSVEFITIAKFDQAVEAHLARDRALSQVPTRAATTAKQQEEAPNE